MSSYINQDLLLNQNEDRHVDYPAGSGITPVYVLNGSIVSLVGWSAQMMVRINKTDTSPILTVSSSSATSNGSIITLGGAAGTVDALLRAADVNAITKLLPGLVAYYDLLLTDASSPALNHRFMQGAISIDLAVTR